MPLCTVWGAVPKGAKKSKTTKPVKTATPVKYTAPAKPAAYPATYTPQAKPTPSPNKLKIAEIEKLEGGLGLSYALSGVLVAGGGAAVTAGILLFGQVKTYDHITSSYVYTGGNYWGFWSCVGGGAFLLGAGAFIGISAIMQHSQYETQKRRLSMSLSPALFAETRSSGYAPGIAFSLAF